MVELLGKIPPGVPMMDVLRTGASVLAHWDPDAADNSHDANLRKAEHLLAQLPVVMAARYRLAHGQKAGGVRRQAVAGRQHPVDALRQAADRAADQGDGRVADSVCRARVQRLDVRGPRGQLDACPTCTRRSRRRSARSRARCTAERTKP